MGLRDPVPVTSSTAKGQDDSIRRAQSLDMKAFFFSPNCLLRPTTNRIFDVRVCDNLAKAHVEVELIAPHRRLPYNIARSELRSHYGVTSDLNITIQPTPLIGAKVPAIVEILVLLVANLLSTIRIAIAHRRDLAEAIILTRSPMLLVQPILIARLIPSRSRYRTFLFLHEVKQSPLHKWIYQRADGLIAISLESKSAVENLGVSPERSFALLSPIPDSLLDDAFDREEVRGGLGLNHDDRPLVVYTGKLYPAQREIEFILEAAVSLPNCRFLFTGGKDSAVSFYKARCQELGIANAIFTGFIDDSTRIKDYQRAADVLVSYYTSDDHMLAFNFPQKIAEYMCSGAPIVTPDHPATRGVLNKTNAIFVDAENTDSLAEGIRLAVENKELARATAEKAVKDARRFTYTERTRLLVEFVRDIQTRSTG